MARLLICPRCRRQSVDTNYSSGMRCLRRDCGWTIWEGDEPRYAWSAEFPPPEQSDPYKDDFISPIGEIEDVLDHACRSKLRLLEKMKDDPKWFIPATKVQLAIDAINEALKELWR